MSDLVSMGGYGAYVWGAYGFAIASLVGLLWQSRRFARKQQAAVAALRPARGQIGHAGRKHVARRLDGDTAASPAPAGPHDGDAAMGLVARSPR